MAIVINYVPYVNGFGKPLKAEINVTPSWWPRRRRNAFARVAGLIADRPGSFTALSLGEDMLLVQATLYKSCKRGDKDIDMSLERRVGELQSALEALGAEYAFPEDSRVDP